MRGEGLYTVTTCIVLPAFNEARAVPGLLRELAGLSAKLPGLRLLLVDDGSADGTAGAAGAAGAEVVRHARNLGLGRALMTGFAAALSDPATRCVVTMDADGTVGAGVALALALAVLVDGAGLAVASRRVPGARVSGVPLLRRAASGAGALLCRAALGAVARDWTSGFRAYSRGTLESVIGRWGGGLVTARGPACQIELLWKCAPFAGRVAEVPLVLDYGPKRGKSSTRLAAHSLEAVRLLARLTAGSVLPEAGSNHAAELRKSPGRG